MPLVVSRPFVRNLSHWSSLAGSLPSFLAGEQTSLPHFFNHNILYQVFSFQALEHDSLDEFESDEDDGDNTGIIQNSGEKPIAKPLRQKTEGIYNETDAVIVLHV